jgi:hypothetical protein
VLRLAVKSAGIVFVAGFSWDVCSAGFSGVAFSGGFCGTASWAWELDPKHTIRINDIAKTDM